MEHLAKQIIEARQQIASAMAYISTVEQHLSELAEQVAALPIPNLGWVYPSRPLRFSVAPSMALTNPELIPLMSFADLTGIPYELLGEGVRRYYLEQIEPEHLALLTGAGITIENKEP